MIEESESFSNKEKEKIISELLYFRLVLLYFMLLFERKFGGKNYDEGELIDILPLGVCLAFEDNGIDKENAEKRTEIFLDRLLYNVALVAGTGENAVEIIETEAYFHLTKRFVDDMLGVNEVELVERFKDKRFATKHHELLNFASQAYHLDDNNFKNNLKEFKFVD